MKDGSKVRGPVNSHDLFICNFILSSLGGLLARCDSILADHNVGGENHEPRVGWVGFTFQASQ